MSILFVNADLARITADLRRRGDISVPANDFPSGLSSATVLNNHLRLQHIHIGDHHYRFISFFLVQLCDLKKDILFTLVDQTGIPRQL